MRLRISCRVAIVSFYGAFCISNVAADDRLAQLETILDEPGSDTTTTMTRQIDPQNLETSPFNVTAHYIQLMNQQDKNEVLDQASLCEIRNQYQILFVMGFLSDLIVKIGGAYFNDQMTWLKNERVDHFRADKTNSQFDSERLPSENAGVLKRKIEELYQTNSRKKVLVISHSKGGLDTLVALRKYPAILNEKVAGWIPLQTPFEGTHLADWVTSQEKDDLRNTISGTFMRNIFGGNEVVIQTMRRDRRAQAMREKAETIRDIARKIPILAFASWKERNLTPGQWTALFATRDLMKKLAQVDNDGVVPVDGAILRVDGRAVSPFIRIEGIDHLLPVANAIPGYNVNAPGFKRLDRVGFTKVLLRLWLEIRHKKISNG
jgi:hypothetical protein